MASKDYSLRAIFTAVDRITGPLRGVNLSMKKVRDSVKGVGDAGSKLAGAVAPVAAVGAAVGAFAGKAVKDFLDTSGALADMSDRLGISAEKLQEWQYVAEKSGVSGEDMQGSMEKLNKAIYQAASGKGDGAALFKRLGISVRNADGSLRNAADILPQLADAFAKNENPTLRTAMAMQLMGKSGGAMIGVLAQGSSAIKEQQAEARKLGIIISDADIAMADAFADGPLANFTKQLGALTMMVGAKLVPVLAPMVEKMSAWLTANQASIAASITRGVQGIADAIQKIDLDAVITGMKIAFGVVVAGQVLSIVSAVAGLAAAMGALGLAAAPIIGVVALLGAAGFMLWKNWDGVVGGLKALWEDFGTWIGPKIEAITSKLRPLTSVFSRVGGWISGLGGGSVSPGAGNAGPGIIGAGKQNVQGEMVVRFDNAPPGMRVDQGKTNMPGLNLNPDVGYRSMAWG